MFFFWFCFLMILRKLVPKSMYLGIKRIFSFPSVWTFVGYKLKLKMSYQYCLINFFFLSFDSFFRSFCFCWSSGIRTHLEICYQVFEMGVFSSTWHSYLCLSFQEYFLPWGSMLDKIRIGSEVCCFEVGGRRAIVKEVEAVNLQTLAHS